MINRAEQQWPAETNDRRRIAQQMLEQLRAVYCDLTVEDRAAAKAEMRALALELGEI
jgi:hypothetical protein